MYYQFFMLYMYMLIWVYHLMQCMANLGGSRNFREGLAGIYRFEISVSRKVVDFKRLHNAITIFVSIGIIVTNIIVIYFVHTKECHNKVLLYVIYSFISSPATKVTCYRHLGPTYNSSHATSVLGILINRLLRMCGLD